MSSFGEDLKKMSTLVGGASNVFGQALNAVAETVTAALFYSDGVTETKYGLAMERA